MITNNAFACPMDQLYLAGRLRMEGDEDIRYLAGKRLRGCSATEFAHVSHFFRLSIDLVYLITRSGSPTLPPCSDKWLPAFLDSLDSAAQYWGIQREDDLEEPAKALELECQ